MISDEERVFAILLKLGGAATSREIAKILGWSSGRPATKVGHRMKVLIEEGKVERVGPGVYRLKQTIPQFLK